MPVAREWTVAPAVRPRPPRSARPSFPHSSPVSFRTSNRNHREMTRARVKPDVGLDTIEPPDHGCREHLAGASLCEYSSVAQQHEIAAERGGKVEVVGGEHERHAPVTIESAEQRRNLELIAEIE